MRTGERVDTSTKECISSFHATTPKKHHCKKEEEKFWYKSNRQNSTMKHMMFHQSKRRHPKRLDGEISSSEDEFSKKNTSKPPNEKKVKPRTSPPTSESDTYCDNKLNKLKINSENDEASESVTLKEIIDPGEGTTRESEKESEPEQEEASPEKLEDTKPDNNKITESKNMENQWKSIDEKMNISVGHKATKGQFRFDFLGDEVDQAEADALSALNNYWLTSIAKKAAKPSTDIPEEHKPFYNKYCNGTKKLSIETATRLMSYPHVIAITLKSNAKIEVITSDVEKALEKNAELREPHFDVVTAMGMHLF
ncbi:uncharacterized protein LOC5517073 isoform X2 [Nematostella vectensis]|uniref:uncharacterized protein LOC5517073 isoform X2 n=1 Tax=Nematostella vectensis TaxID=45351 RepID=UPI00207718ED|nr:uncharacterized protein LOC5517073 isoform X2 [Nematostella vectensis]